MFLQERYSEVAPRLINWLEVANTGNANIANLALDLLNRACASLQLEAPTGWDYLTVDRYALTLSGTSGLECALPADCGVILKVYTDPTGTEKPTIYYHKDGRINTGFKLASAFAIEGLSTDSGVTFTPVDGFSATKIKFFYAPISAPFLRYQVLVPKFTGVTTKTVGQTTYTRDEFCAFPGELLLLEAQRIRCREKGMVNEWKMMQPEHAAFLKKFKDQHQNVAEDFQVDVTDSQGNPLQIPEYGLGTGSAVRAPWGTRNDQDNLIR
jgi:hypothetical protein